jgi:hypothetical protein
MAVRVAVAPTTGPLGATLQATALVLEAIAPVLQPIAFPLPDSPAVLLAPALQLLPTALPVPAAPLHPIAVPLQPLAATLETPPLTPVVAHVPRMLPSRLALGTLDREWVGWADLRGQRRRREPEPGREGKRLISISHDHPPPAAGPRGSYGNGVLERTGGETTR